MLLNALHAVSTSKNISTITKKRIEKLISIDVSV